MHLFAVQSASATGTSTSTIFTASMGIRSTAVHRRLMFTIYKVESLRMHLYCLQYKVQVLQVRVQVPFLQKSMGIRYKHGFGLVSTYAVVLACSTRGSTKCKCYRYEYKYHFYSKHGYHVHRILYYMTPYSRHTCTVQVSDITSTVEEFIQKYVFVHGYRTIQVDYGTVHRIPYIYIFYVFTCTCTCLKYEVQVVPVRVLYKYCQIHF
jgi:hypothetical protein